MDPFTQLQIGQQHLDELRAEAARYAFAKGACAATTECSRGAFEAMRDLGGSMLRRVGGHHPAPSPQR